MFKALKRMIAFFTFVVVILGALKTLFDWVAKSTNDNHEVFIDEEEREAQF